MTVAATIPAAMQDIVKVFTDVWTDALDVPGTPFDIKAISDQDVWARLRLQHTDGGQRTLAGADARTRFGRSGNVIITLNYPKAQGVKDVYAGAESVVKAYETARTPNGVWFRNVRMIETDDTTPFVWYPITIIADFDYEQFS